MSKDINNISEFRELILNLADDITHLIVREHHVLNNEFLQISSIIEDASKTIQESFNDLIEQSERQSKMLKVVGDTSSESGNQQLSRYQEQVEKINREITGEINKNAMKVVRSIQFEDIVQQLIGHSSSRVIKMEALFSELTKEIGKLKAEDTNDLTTISTVLGRMRDDILSVKKELERGNPVKQKSMDKGEIDFF